MQKQSSIVSISCVSGQFNISLNFLSVTLKAAAEPNNKAPKRDLQLHCIFIDFFHHGHFFGESREQECMRRGDWWHADSAAAGYVIANATTVKCLVILRFFLTISQLSLTEG